MQSLPGLAHVSSLFCSFQRAIGENETFIKLVGDPGLALGRGHWTINSIAPTGFLRAETLPSVFLKAWKTLRLNPPSIAVLAVHEKTLEYVIPDNATLKNWPSETFHR
ncbi:hypothetical protein ABVK25_001592 [Lepraria finkii]|uniref:Uncharacterized protein n=1 Tax=Lepraria finkii TaxID=1340010 RepID=A0ABR4BJV8_9LECA